MVFFGEDTPYNLIKITQPDILVKGADYKPEDIVGYDIVKNKDFFIQGINRLKTAYSKNINVVLVSPNILYG